MNCNILGLLCLSSEDYYTSNIIQRASIPQASMEAFIEKRRTVTFDTEVRRLSKIAESYSDIMEDEFHVEFLRISSGCTVDINSDLDDQTNSIIDGALLILCLALLIIIDAIFQSFNHEETIVPSDHHTFDEECLRLAVLADEFHEGASFEDECFRLASLSLTIDYSHLFDKEFKRLAHLQEAACKDTEFEREFSRMAKLASTLTYEREFCQEVARLSDLVATIDESHEFERECKRMSKLVSILCKDVPSNDAARKSDCSSTSRTLDIDFV